jgi:hypothetical protein
MENTRNRLLLNDQHDARRGTRVRLLPEDTCCVSERSASSLSVGREWEFRPGAEIIVSLVPESPHSSRWYMSSSPEHIVVRSSCDNCARIKKLGYVAGKHMDLYGEHMELVSDPFEEGDCVAVHAFSSSNTTVRTIKLPVSILTGWDDLFQ